MTKEQKEAVRYALVWDIAALIGVCSYVINGWTGLILTISVWTLTDVLWFPRGGK